jgi:toxin ParE1/3/4
MKRRGIVYLPTATRDLREIAGWIADRTSNSFAVHYVERIQERIETLSHGGERGTLRNDVRPGLRVIGIMKSVTLAFFIEEDAVMIARVLYGGRNWQQDLSSSDVPEES